MSSPVRAVAVITAYRPGPSLTTAVRSALPQVERVVVVDDGSTEGQDVLDACVALGAHVVRHGSNRGIGAALNTGIREARSQDPAVTHVLTLDQDSVLPERLVTDLADAGRAAADAGVRVGMVAPGHVATVRSNAAGADAPYALAGEPIQSGLLVPTAVIDEVGPFDESLVIDGVDTDFWLRALDRGLAAIVAPRARLEHRLGNPIVLAGGRQLPLTVASTFRYYYQWRNLVVLLRRHGRRHPRWAVGALARAARHLAIVTVLAPGRGGRLRESAAGLRAGLRNGGGPRPEPGETPTRA